MKKAYLVLEDGSIFEGFGFGAEGNTVGEMVFTTGTCGYIETLTDPSYYGQIVVQTFPLIGNYGVIEEDFEGKCCVAGYIVKTFCDAPSNFRSMYDLDTYLKKQGIVGLYGIDTRMLTGIIRSNGCMNAMITDKLPADIKKIKAYRIQDAVKTVTSDIAKEYKLPDAKFKVTVIDYGAKNNIVRELLKRKCAVKTVPSFYTAEEILKDNPDGIMLSNGPGDPGENTACIQELKKLMGKKPMFGICLGHQLMALAQGGTTRKMKYGHRGVNQPVKDLTGNRTYITSQNHGYEVVSDSIKSGRVRYKNANDDTCEGIDYEELKAFSVQFHPEACAGPKDTEFLFGQFIRLMEGS